MVNGEWITKTELQAEVDRYLDAQLALGFEVSEEEATKTVLEDLIDQLLLAQAAHGKGFELTDAELQIRMDALASHLGSENALADWQSQHGYKEETFRSALRRMIAAAWMRDRIIAAVPTTAEQVHVRQILLYNEEDALNVADQLEAGADFTDLAKRYDPNTGGELGWFPHGYLFDQALEEAAFNLQPGQYSEIISSEVGYHILQVIERDANHQLSPDSYLVLQEKALQEWLLDERSAALIERNP